MKKIALIVTIIGTLFFLIFEYLLLNDPIGKSDKFGTHLISFLMCYTIPGILWIIVFFINMLNQNSLNNGKKSELNLDNNLKENITSFNIESRYKGENDKKEKPPTFLLVLCILTFVNTGFTVLGGLMGMLSGKPSSEEIKDSKVQMAKSIDQLEKLNMDYWVDVLKRLDAMTDAMYANFVAYNGVAILVALIGAFAAFLMFQAKKVGFHAYIVYSFLYVIQGYLFISPEIMPAFVIIFNFIIAGIFVLLYSRNLSWMNK